MPSEILLFLFATAAAAALLLISRSVQRASQHHRLEPEQLAAMERSARRVRSSRDHRRPPTGSKQSALLPGRHAG